MSLIPVRCNPTCTATPFRSNDLQHQCLAMDSDNLHSSYIPNGQNHMISGIETVTITITSGNPSLK